MAQAITKAGEEAQRVVESLNSAGLVYGDVRDEAATLKGYVGLARALVTDDPEVWQGLPRQVIQHIVKGAVTWARTEERDVQVPPSDMTRRLEGISSWTRLSLSEILLWATPAWQSMVRP